MVVERIDGDSAERKPGVTAWGLPVVDLEIRQAISHCWLVMPPEKKTTRDVGLEIRRLVDRALKDLHEDTRAFALEP